MDLQHTLVNCGLEPKEAQVYLALLELGAEKVQMIARRAALKRPTTYVILEQLSAKNFVIKTYRAKKIVYSAEKPDILLRALQQKEELLTSALPFLTMRMSAHDSRPRISIHEDKAGVERVYDDIYHSESVCFFGAIKNLSDEFKGLTEKITKIIKAKKVSVRDLLTHDPKDSDFALAAEGRNYEARVVPKEFDLLSDGAIYGNKVAILSIRKDLFAVVIESKEVADTFRSLFELAWRQATPFGGVVSKK